MTAPDLGGRYVLENEPLPLLPADSFWAGRDRQEDRDVLVRLVRTQAWPEALATLFQGAHPSLLPIVDALTLPGGEHVVVYERTRTKPLPTDPAPTPTYWTAQVTALLEGLAHIHGLGWVHGALHPDTLLATERGDLLLVDPGAMFRAQPPVSEAPWRAPELEPGDAPTVAADLYALGAIGALLATGEAPTPLGPDELVSAAPGLTAAGRRWLSGLLRADPRARPASAHAALVALEEVVERGLRRSATERCRMTSVGPVGRQELVGRLAAAAASGGLGIVLGDQDSGRTTVLRAIHHRLQRVGRRSQLITLGRDPVRSHLALRTLLADHGDFSERPPRQGLAPAAQAAGLRNYESALLAATIALLEAPSGPFLFDDVDGATLAGRVLVAALERSRSPGAVLTTDGGSQTVMEGLVTARGDSRDLPAVLSPLHGEQIAQWMHEALGPVARPFALAELLRAETDGLPGLVISQVALLLDKGALTRGDQDWRWSEDFVLPLLGGITQPIGPLGRGSSEERLLAALDAADRAAAAADPRAALTGLQSELELHGHDDGPPDLLGRVWARIAHFAMVLNEPSIAADALGQVRTRAPMDDPARAVALLVQEARALRGAGDWRAALELLDADQARIEEHGDPDTKRQSWATRASCLLKSGDLVAAEEAVTALEADADTSPDWLTRATALRANLELSAGRARAAAEACVRALARLGDDERSLRATLSSTLGTALSTVGHTTEALSAFATARDLFVAEELFLEAARVTNKLGVTRYEASDWAGAEADWGRFRDLSRRADDPWELCCALTNLGGLYRETGHLDRAAESLEEALRLARRRRLGRLEPAAMTSLASAWARMGDTALAADAMQEAIELSDHHGWWRESIEAMRALAVLRLDQRDLQSCRHLLDQVHARIVSLDEDQLQLEVSALQALLGLLGEGTREGDESRALEAIRGLGDVGATVVAARLQVRLAEALVGTGRFGPAESLLDEAEAVLRPLSARPDLARVEEARRLLVSATRTSLQTLTRHHDWLQELTLALSRERELEPLVELVLDRALNLVDEERGLVRLFDERGVPSLQVARQVEAKDTGSHRTLASEEAEESPGQRLTSAIIAKVVRTGAPLVIPDLQADPELSKLAVNTPGRQRGVLCVPIMRSNDLLGVIYVDGPTVRGPGPDMKAELLMACADAASVAIENARLIEALKRKQDALAIMAHELRTPITSIIGFASLLLSPDEDRTVQEDTEMIGLIKSEAERVRGMVGRVLELARMQAGDAEWKRDPVDALALVVAGVDSLRPLARQSEVKLQAEADEELPDLIGDEERLIQVMVNIVGNALKFVPFGGCVMVAARAQDDGVLITVEDDGPGIPAERLTRIFEPWQQAGSSRMRRKGVGLGLAISQAIVQRHGGWIGATNREEGGARFSVWLPAAPLD